MHICKNANRIGGFLEDDRIKWNLRYQSDGFYLGENTSPFLAREISRIKRLAPGATALDIACGEGRNSIFLAHHGFSVTGVDISDVGLAKAAARAAMEGVEVDFRRVDLEQYEIIERYDLILNFNFLLRELIPKELMALRPGGLLLFDTIMESPQLLANHKQSYLLRHGELVRLFENRAGKILFSEESHSGEMPTARLLFQKSLNDS